MENVKKVCQNCKNYDRRTKKCKISNEYTARKETCDDFKEGK